MPSLNSELIDAVKEGNLKNTKLLLEQGANVKIADNNNTGLIHVAAQNNYDQILEELLKYKADVNAVTFDNWSALHFAAMCGYEKIVRILIKGGIDVNIIGLLYGRTALHYAADKGHSEVVKLILEAGAKTDIIDKNGETPISIAHRKGYEAIINLLSSK